MHATHLVIFRGILEVDLEAANQVRDGIPVVLDPKYAVLKITTLNCQQQI